MFILAKRLASIISHMKTAHTTATQVWQTRHDKGKTRKDPPPPNLCHQIFVIAVSTERVREDSRQTDDQERQTLLYLYIPV